MPIPRNPETPAERKARHCADLSELQQLGMGLARSAAAAAAAQLDQPDQASTPSDSERASRDHAPRIDHALAFTRISRLVKQAIALENRIADGTPAPPKRTLYQRSPTLSDPRRALLRTALHDAVQSDPDRTQRRREIDQRLDEGLQADPAQQIDPVQLLQTIAQDLEINLDPSRLHDDLLGLKRPTIPDRTSTEREPPDIPADPVPPDRRNR